MTKTRKAWTALERLRINAGLTRTQLARKAELSLSYYCQIERGTRKGANAEVLARIAGALGVEPWELHQTRPSNEVAA